MPINISYFEAPKEFMLYPSPSLHLLRSEDVVLNQKELSSKNVRLILADWRCDSIKMSLRFLGSNREESIKIYCGFDSTCTLISYSTPDNWWTNMYTWIFRKQIKCKGLSMVVLFEQFLGIEDVEGKFGIYVDFLRPEVVVVSGFWIKTGMHEHLLHHYNDCMTLHLQENGEIVVWLYFDNNKVRVAGDRGKGNSVVEIKRVGKI